MRFHLLMRSLLIIIAVAGLGYFSFQYINPSGELEVYYDFCQEETPYFSGLSPHGRVLDINNKLCDQKMVIDPVYFDVRLPQSYQSAEIKLIAQLPAKQDLAIGVGIDPDNWQWEFGEQSVSGLYILNLNEAKFVNNRYRFIISTPGLDVSGQEVIFKNMELKFSKQPLGRENFKQRLRSILN